MIFISRPSAGFFEEYRRLPRHIREKAKKAYRLFQNNPSHRSLDFKPIRSLNGVYSARVDNDYRVLGRRDGNVIYWFWIGPHSEYDRMIP